jgi:acylpyruvate hydrolase
MTPAGVGIGRNPPVFMKAGDTVEIELEGVGTLTNTLA